MAGSDDNFQYNSERKEQASKCDLITDGVKLLGSRYAVVSGQTRSENKRGGMPLSEFLSELSCPLFCDAEDTLSWLQKWALPCFSAGVEMTAWTMRKFILEMQSVRYFQSLFCLKATFAKENAKGQAPTSSMLPMCTNNRVQSPVLI